MIKCDKYSMFDIMIVIDEPSSKHIKLKNIEPKDCRLHHIEIYNTFPYLWDKAFLLPASNMHRTYQWVTWKNLNVKKYYELIKDNLTF